jgi:type II secretory pathway pseudopilin PulG
MKGASSNARDAERVQNLGQIRLALELYYDEYGHYPGIFGWATSEPTSYDSGNQWASLQSALAEFLPKLPGDPSPAGNSGPWTTGNYHYAYGSYDGQIYDLVAQLENSSNQNTCEHKCWRYHQGEGGYPPDTPWCSACPSGAGWSPYMYADH